MEFELSILGPLEAYRDGRKIPIGGQLQRALLAVLGLQVGERIPADALLWKLWGDEPPPTARASLHNAVSRLRKTLGPDVLITTLDGGYALVVNPDAVDARRFETMVEEARELPPAERDTRLLEGLALWRGAPLGEFPSPAIEDAVVRLEELRFTAIEERLDAELELARHEHVVPELEALVVRHPLRESLWQRLILALYRSGRQAEALAAYRQAHRRLEELGIEPGRKLNELQRMVLVQDRSLELGAGPSGDLLIRLTGGLPISPPERARASYDHAVTLVARRARALDGAAGNGDRRCTRGRRPIARGRAWLLLGGSDSVPRARASRSCSCGHARRRARPGNRSRVRRGPRATSARSAAARPRPLHGGSRGLWKPAALYHPHHRQWWEEADTMSALGFTLAVGPTPAREALARCRALLAEIDTEPASIGLWCRLRPSSLRCSRRATRPMPCSSWPAEHFQGRGFPGPACLHTRSDRVVTPARGGSGVRRARIPNCGRDARRARRPGIPVGGFLGVTCLPARPARTPGRG